MFYHKYILIFIAIAFTAAPSEGYFKKNDHNEYSRTSLSETIAFSKKHDLFVPAVYKNNPQSTANIKNNIIFGHQSDLLTELMALDIRHITQPIQSNTLESGRFIENLIYANLRIQQLIDEHKKLIEKAKQLNSQYAIPSFDIPIDYGKAIGQDNKSIYTEIQKVNDEFDQLTNGMQVAVNDQEKAQPSQSAKNSSDQAISVTGNTFTIPFNTSPTFTNNHPKGISASHISRNTTGLLNHEINTNTSDKANAREVRKPIKPSELPWIFEIFISLIKYFMENKIEGLIYMGMILFVVSVLAGGRR